MRLGCISFINCLPVNLPLKGGHVPFAGEMISLPPAELNALMKIGALDASAMSAFAFLEQKSLTIIDTLSISSLGPVGSVLLFSSRSPETLHQARIAVPSSSATSVNLLHILLAEEYGLSFHPSVEKTPPAPGGEFAASLVIGDYALLVDEEWSKHFYRVDLGAWWYRLFSLPCVFGVWATQKDAPPATQTLQKTLQQAVYCGLNSIYEEVIQTASTISNLPISRLHQYYREELNFQFTPDHRRSLEHYQQLSAKHGLLSCSVLPQKEI